MLIWVVVLSSAAMMMYTTMGARFGAVQERSFLQAVADRYGRWFAALIGLAAFLMSASFQFGNNLGVTTATASVTENWASRTLSGLLGRPVVEEQIWPFVFTGAAMLMVLFASNLYRVIERVMIVLVLIMIGAFFTNLVFAQPNLAKAAEGLIPRIPGGGQGTTVISAMVGTTFVMHACLYQSYLVQSKGWRLPDVRKGLVDSMVGITLLATISVLIMLTSAAALRPRGIVISDASEMALQLQSAFGPAAKAIFCLGFWAAAFSSIPVNAIVGGGLLADGLGLGHRMDQKWPKAFTLVIMILGMFIATMPQENRANALVVAQAATMLAVPAVGLGMFLILNDKTVMGRFVNSWRQNILAGFGLVLVVVLSVATYGKLIDQIGKVRAQWRSEAPAATAPLAEPEGGRSG
jgi:Mn2+/Fe2+ NRAMP family transporter